jgi:hypothetical protein
MSQSEAITRKPVNDKGQTDTTNVLAEKMHLARSLSRHAKQIVKELRSLCTLETKELVQGLTWGGKTCIVDKREIANNNCEEPKAMTGSRQR